MSYQLKILSGSLNGVEYTLHPGDTVFHVGSQRDLLDGRAAQLLQGAENAYFLPEDLPPSSFVVQLQDAADGVPPLLRMGERMQSHLPWQYRTLPLQQPIAAGGVYVAVRDSAEPWSQEVQAFSVPLADVVPGVQDAPLARVGVRAPQRGSRRRTLLVAGALAAALIAVAAGWFYWQYRPEVRVQGLASVLRDAPADYQILPGNDGKLYAFTDDKDGVAWGERASRRLQRRDDAFLLRRDEAQRLEEELLSAGLSVVIVRLDQPAQPQVVLLAPMSTAQRENAQAIIARHAPYAARAATVSITTDAALVILAQEQLRGLGIGSRPEPYGSRVSVVNDVFLDDAALHAMTRMASRFHHEWGQRRITVHPQLWDDLLQGRSYRYSPGQLMSVGEGRWIYARGTHGAAPASP